MARRNQQRSRAEDAIIRDVSPTDMVILVMGLSGVGKSTFINAVLEEERTDIMPMPVGRALTSCTVEVNHAVINPNRWVKDRRLVLVDTPGFNDTYKSDAEILRRIAAWLEAAYRQKIRLSGIIYLHDISQEKFSAADSKSLQIFKHLCGDAALRNVVIGTTKWGKVMSNLAEAEKREQDLRCEVWKSMIDSGSKVHKFCGTKSALEFIDKVLHPKVTDIFLEIQKELVRNQKTVAETKAGRLAGASAHPEGWWKNLIRSLCFKLF